MPKVKHNAVRKTEPNLRNAQTGGQVGAKTNKRMDS